MTFDMGELNGNEEYCELTSMVPINEFISRKIQVGRHPFGE